MDYFATIDCGTTNSRINILNDNMQIISRADKKIGVKDTSIQGTRDVLKKGLKEVFLKAIDQALLTVNDIKFVLASGMITSEIGLKEVPHLWAPAGINELAKSIEIVNDREVFPLDIPLILIRGIKNNYKENSTYKDLNCMDFMRGEETQVIGIINKYDDIVPPFTTVVLSSHTKYIDVNKEGLITGSLTTLSGQLYEAIKDKTVIGKSVLSKELDDSLDTEIINTAYDSVKNTGFLRTLLMPRFMEVLIDTTALQRKLFLETTIIADDLKTINSFEINDMPINDTFVIVGRPQRCKLFSYLLQKHYNIKKVKMITKKSEIDELSTEGSIEIVKKAGFFK